jgi:membrane-associated PAP2 superfamily phosphatase
MMHAWPGGHAVYGFVLSCLLFSHCCCTLALYSYSFI